MEHLFFKHLFNDQIEDAFYSLQLKDVVVILPIGGGLLDPKFHVIEKILPCHRNERSHEIALLLRELIALSPSFDERSHLLLCREHAKSQGKIKGQIL